MKEIFASITKAEWRFVAGVILAVILLTNLPYLYGYWAAPPGQTFIGFHGVNPVDYAVYYSYIKQAISGQVLFYDLFTTEPGRYGTLNIAWLMVGWAGKLLAISPGAAFHLARILFTPPLLLLLYLFVSFFFADALRRKIGFLLLAFGSGLGFSTIPWFSQIIVSSDFFNTTDLWPWDLGSPKANIFYSIYHDPHFILSWLFLLLIFLLSLLAFQRRRGVYALAAGAAGLVFFNFHPYFIFLVFSVLPLYGAYFFIRQKKFDWRLSGWFLAGGLLAFLPVGYHYFLIKQDLVIGLRSGQNVCPVLFFLPVLAAFGLLLPLAAIGGYDLSRRKAWRPEWVFLLIWLLANFTLLFLPTPFQNVFVEGIQFPLVIFSVIGLSGLYQRLSRLSGFWFRDLIVCNPYAWAMLFFLFFCLSNVFNVSRDIHLYYLRQPILYHSADVTAAYRWLDAQTPKPKIVLAGEYLALLTPGFSGQKVYFGHGHETLFYDRKMIVVAWFYQTNAADAQKQKWLAAEKIDYVVYGADEKNMGVFRPEEKDYLRLVFDSATTQIFAVVK